METATGKDLSNKATTPDELDNLIKIAKPSAWMILSGLTLLTVVLFIWGIWGSIPQKVNGIGIITSKSGIYRVTTAYKGVVEEVFYELGDSVVVGSVLLRIQQPELMSDINEAKLQLHSLYVQDTILKTSDEGVRKARIQFYALQIERGNKQLENLKHKVAFFEDKVEKQETLIDKGLITQSEFEGTKENLKDLNVEINTVQEQIKENQISQMEWEYSKKTRSQDLNAQIELLVKKINDLQDEFERQALVKSPCTGIIVEQMVAAGDVVSPNANLYVIEEPNIKDKYILELYIPFNSDAKVDVGQDAEIVPFTVNKEKYGQMLGVVIKVNKFPSSTSSLMEDLKNDELVDLLNKQGPKYKVIVDLTDDRTTVSKFRWTSPNGPPYSVTSGTLCQGYVTVRNKSPFDLVIPLLKEFVE
ncbi:MAG: hypothetical protein QG635_2314 [Bacteroidota bacterium]|nr:hypothetical protein [Bacteroidota bacterium]